MRYVVISSKKYTEKEELLCIFDNTSQFKNKKQLVTGLARNYYKCEVKLDYVNKEEAYLLIDDYIKVWDFREGQEEQLIKSWYMSKYPNDKIGENINEQTTFALLMTYIERKRGLSYILGIQIDSIVRSRILERLQEIYKLSDEDLQNLFTRIVIEL